MPYFGPRVIGEEAHKKEAAVEKRGGTHFGPRVVGPTGSKATPKAIEGAADKRAKGQSTGLAIDPLVSGLSADVIPALLAGNDTLIDGIFEAELARQEGPRREVIHAIRVAAAAANRGDILADITELGHPESNPAAPEPHPQSTTDPNVNREDYEERDEDGDPKRLATGPESSGMTKTVQDMGIEPTRFGRRVAKNATAQLEEVREERAERQERAHAVDAGRQAGLAAAEEGEGRSDKDVETLRRSEAAKAEQATKGMGYIPLGDVVAEGNDDDAGDGEEGSPMASGTGHDGLGSPWPGKEQGESGDGRGTNPTSTSEDRPRVTRTTTASKSAAKSAASKPASESKPKAKTARVRKSRAKSANKSASKSTDK